MDLVFAPISFWLALAFGIVMLVTAFLHTHRLEKLRCHKLSPISKDMASASVIMALKGIEPSLKANLDTIFSQDHPNLEFIFCVESEQDPAYLFVEQALAEVARHQPKPKAQLVVAGIGLERSQKITNLMAGLELASENSEYLVFLDSDIHLDKQYVRHLLEPLKDPSIGATTGYRWCQPDRPTFGGMLCSTWNAGVFLAIADPVLSFTWGGTMAITRETFTRAKVLEAWQSTVSDDLSLTRAVKHLGLTIRYVPECVPITYETLTLGEALEFTSRQMLLARVYHPLVWWTNAVIHPAIVGTLLYGFFNLAAWLMSGKESYLAGAGGLVLLPFLYASTYWLIIKGAKWMPEISQSVLERRWYYVLMAPIASLLTTCNSVKNLLTRKMVWRNIEYELISPERVIVTRRENAAYGDTQSLHGQH